MAALSRRFRNCLAAWQTATLTRKPSLMLKWQSNSGSTQPVNSVALFPSRGVGFITHNNRFVPTCPPDPPRFLLEQMVHEMVAEDRRDAEKDELCKRESYRVVDYYE